MSLSGLVPIRNGLSLDYCFQEAIQSLLPVCDEVVVADGESDDGTQELLREWATRESKLKLCVYPWPNPVGQIDFFVEWIQYGRRHCCSTHICMLDGDEILHEDSYDAVLEYARRKPAHTLRCRRLNFWKDHRHLIPPGVCLGHEVIRLAPQSMWLPSDGAHPLGVDAVMMAVNSRIQIFHYGFLRRPDAYFAKSKLLHGFFFGTYDDRLTQAEAATAGGGNWMTAIKSVEWTDRLVPFDGTHPKVAHEWLRSHGYSLP